MKRFTSTVVSKASPTSSTSSTWSSDGTLHQSETTTSLWPSLQSAQLSEDIPRSPYTRSDEVYVWYTVKNLCRGPLALVYGDIVPSNSAGLHPHRLMMNECLMAMAKVFYGFHKRETIVLQDGVRLYGRGMGMLRGFLSEVDCSVTTEMIISVFSLCIGEVCTLPIEVGFRLCLADLKSRRASCPLASLHGWLIFSASNGSSL